MAHFAQSPYFVLHQLTCQFADGETLFGPLDLAFDRSRCGLVGRNGVGKTQLLRLIAGRIGRASGTSNPMPYWLTLRSSRRAR